MTSVTQGRPENQQKTLHMGQDVETRHYEIAELTQSRHLHNDDKNARRTISSCVSFLSATGNPESAIHDVMTQQHRQHGWITRGCKHC